MNIKTQKPRKPSPVEVLRQMLRDQERFAEIAPSGQARSDAARAAEVLRVALRRIELARA